MIRQGAVCARWRKINVAYYREDHKFMRFLVPPEKRVLELGCGQSESPAAPEPACGFGVDFSPDAIAPARQDYPHLDFRLGDVEESTTLATIKGPFDYIVIADTIGMFEDIDDTLRHVHRLCGPSTRIIISYYSHLWEPILTLGEPLRFKSRRPKINYIAGVQATGSLSNARGIGMLAKTSGTSRS